MVHGRAGMPWFVVGVGGPWSVIGVGGPWSMVGVGVPWSLWVLCGQCGRAPVCGWCGWSVVGVGGPWLVWVHCFPAEGHLVAARISVL